MTNTEKEIVALNQQLFFEQMQFKKALHTSLSAAKYWYESSKSTLTEIKVLMNELQMKK